MESVERLKESEALVDHITQLENHLRQREQELDTLIDEYSNKVAN